MLGIGNKTYRNLPEQVAENMRQISKIWEKLDGLDVYDNVVILEDLDPLIPEQLEILARPVSYIVYNNDVYMKRGASASQLFFDKVYNVSEAGGTVTFASGEIVVTYPLGTLALNSASVDTYTTVEIDGLLSAKLNITDILDTIFPVGTIYMTAGSTSPASLFGGTWLELGKHYIPNGNVPVVPTNTVRDISSSEPILKYKQINTGNLASEGTLAINSQSALKCIAGTTSTGEYVVPANLWAHNVNNTYNTDLYLWQRVS